MIKFTSTLPDDQPQILRWALADPYHCAKASIDGPGWWLTGQGVLSGCIEDAGGPTMYFRFDLEGELVRLHTQFAPENEVTKTRVIRVISRAIPALAFKAKQEGAKGFVFESVSPLLIRFMDRMGFKSVENTNDYIFMF